MTITDSRNGKTYEVPVTNSFVKSSDLQKIMNNGKVLRTYDPGYMNTMTCTSKICFIDGDKGILEYRGIPIEELAEKSSFLEVAFLLLYGLLCRPSPLLFSGFTRPQTALFSFSFSFFLLNLILRPPPQSLNHVPFSVRRPSSQC